MRLHMHVQIPACGDPSSDTVLFRTSVHVRRLSVNGAGRKFYCASEVVGRGGDGALLLPLWA